ncbi:MAG: RtcB family protein [Cyanobacteriota bacterium]
MWRFIKKGEAHYKILPELTANKEVEVFGTEQILKEFSDKTIKQASNTANTAGVHKINLNADAHEGYGCPIGSVVATADTVMLGPIGYDISCSMSYIQTDIPIAEIESKKVRRSIIDNLCKYVPQGTGKARAPNQIKISKQLYKQILAEGASSKEVLQQLGIDNTWLESLERTHLEADPDLLSSKVIDRGEGQLGSLGSGNHFLEGQKVKIIDKKIANVFGISENLGLLTHCGSRGLGHQIATEYFEKLWKYSNEKGIIVADKELVYADIDSALGKKYLLSMGCAANFAIINHLVINNAIYSALMDLYPSVKCNFVYHISHNLVQKELIGQKEYYIHRKGATRAFPEGHPYLENTKFIETGHPVIIPGSSISGSSIMVGLPGNEKNFHSTPHGCGRSMGRREAKRRLDQKFVNEKMDEADVLSNRRNYPIDEFSDAYKDYNEVIKSVEIAGLAKEVVKLSPLFVIKGN